MIRIEVHVNDKTVEVYEAGRVLTKNNFHDIDPDHRHVYRVRHLTGPRPGIYRYLMHRYGDGAAVLAQKTIETLNNAE